MMGGLGMGGLGMPGLNGLASGKKGKKMTKDQRIELRQRIAQEQMYMLQLRDMMNLQNMGYLQSMQIPLAHMKQQNTMNALQYANMVSDINDQKMEILEMAKDLMDMKQRLYQVKSERDSNKLARLQGQPTSKATPGVTPTSPVSHGSSALHRLHSASSPG